MARFTRRIGESRSHGANFVIKTIETEARVSERHLAETGRILLSDILKTKREDGRRIIFENDSSLVFPPYFARYAESLKRLLAKFDNLSGTRFPYLTPPHQAPADGGDYRGVHFHIEFHPALRHPNLPKRMAGPEGGIESI